VAAAPTLQQAGPEQPAVAPESGSVVGALPEHHGKYRHPALVMEFNPFPGTFLKNLDEIFNEALGRDDVKSLANCVEVLSHVIARRRPPVSNEARKLLESWEECAGDVVVEAYAHKRNSIDAPYKLRPFDEEIEVKVIAEDDPVKLVLTANWRSIIGDVEFTPHT
jgi:hypothetical protein